MSDASIKIAKQIYEAFSHRDRAQLEKLFDKNFHFTSPLDNRLAYDTYFERCWPLSEEAGEFRFIHVVADGPRVFVTYESKTKDGHMFRNTEIVTIKNNKVTEVEVYFGWDLPHKAPPGSFVDE